MARAAAQPAEKTVNEQLLASAIAKAVLDGDIVNFRLLFGAFSPGRKDSTERFESEKYAYLLPSSDGKLNGALQPLVEKVRAADTWRHIQQELQAKRPPQLPSELLLPLADNAVRHGKYSSAAQAYEVLRIRRRMQALFLDEADAAMGRNDYPRAVESYRIAAGLAYDYAAFPEPLPLIPNYQTEALKLHGVYPQRPEDCPGWLEAEAHSRVALEYLLIDSDTAARAAASPIEQRLKLLQELVRRIDPDWEQFVKRYGDAVTKTLALREYLQRHGVGATAAPETLADEIAEQQTKEPAAIPATLLGWNIEDGAWWQYVKELAYRHPAAPLFIQRQLVGDLEIVIPPLRRKEGLGKSLGLPQLEEAPK